uniref:Uncharacterized protein n=1 Tax=Avena sativa TaxID=4498 RepID=A0ACD5ZZZ8_AVESA
MNDSCWKVDTGHKSGYLTYIEKKMAIKLPHADLKADPHIKSKVKILKKQLSYILEIMQYGSGFGWDDEKKMVTGDRETYMGWAKSREGEGPLYMKPMVNFDKLCEIYANDLAKGEGAKGLGEDVAEGEPTKDGQQTIDLEEGNVAQTHDNIHTSSGYKNGRKRTYPDADTLELGFVNISNSFAKFLEAEQQNTNTMNAIHKAMQHEAKVPGNASSNTDKLLDILQDLPGLTTEEAVMAIRVIGEDVGKTNLFVKMRPGFRVEYVRQELHAAKKKQLQSEESA